MTAQSPIAPDKPPLSKEAISITNAIIEMETAGTFNCDVHGKSGEYGCFQYMPSTWESYSFEILGELVEQTPQNEHIVTATKIERWLKDGYSPRQIFLIWNQGHPGSCVRGVNRYGVSYDSCSYAEKGLSLL